MEKSESQFAPEEYTEGEKSEEERPSYPPRFKIRGAPSEEFSKNVKEHQSKPVGFEGEREKRPEDFVIIEYGNQLGKDLSEKYGFTWAEVPPDFVHFVPEEEHARAHEVQPRHFTILGSNELWPNIDVRDMPLAYSRGRITFHEMVHAESVQRFQAIPDPEEFKRIFFTLKEPLPRDTYHLGRRRSGLTIVSGRTTEAGREEKPYATHLTEAVTSRLEQEAFEDASQDARNPFREESRRMESLNKWLKDDLKDDIGIDNVVNEEALEGLEALMNSGASVEEVRAWGEKFRKRHGWMPHQRSYPNERIEYEYVLEAIRERNPDDFATNDDVHKIFVRAMMNGEILPLARLINKTFKEPPDDSQGKKRTTFGELVEHGLPYLYSKIRLEKKAHG